jgi:hypothetical protein
VWVTGKSNKSSKDLAEQALAHQESEARLDRRHDLNLSEQQAIRVARERIYPAILRTSRTIVIESSALVERAERGGNEVITTQLNQEAMLEMFSDLRVFASARAAECWFRMMDAFGELLTACDKVGAVVGGTEEVEDAEEPLEALRVAMNSARESLREAERELGELLHDDLVPEDLGPLS